MKNSILSEDYLYDNSQEYILGIGDELEIKISDSYAPYTTISLIGPSGTIFLPEINRVYVNGLSISELTNILNQKYYEILKDPDVQIKIKSYRTVKVYLDGEVRNPGLYSFGQQLNNIYEKSDTNKKVNKIFLHFLMR